MDYSAALYELEHFGGDCFVGVDIEAWHPAIFIGLLLAMVSAIGIVVQNTPNWNK